MTIPHLDDVRAALAAHRPGDERERTSLARTLAELDRLDRPFDEHADPVHVTGSAVVVGPRGVVLHRHKRLGIWLQPGGHLEAGEHPAEAAQREAGEETGLGVDHPAERPELVHLDVHPGPKGHTHLDLRYLLVAGDEDPNPPPGESQAVRWFGWSEALAVADDGLRGALEELERRGWPTRRW